jgi:prophage regulatory protein
MKHSSRPTYRIERKPEVLVKTGFSRSTLHLRIKQKLFVPPISLGARAVGWLSYETDAILQALAAGKSHEEIRELVEQLITDRRRTAN